jgi:hypothetical protein
VASFIGLQRDKCGALKLAARALAEVIVANGTSLASQCSLVNTADVAGPGDRQRFALLKPRDRSAGRNYDCAPNLGTCSYMA